jgi:hypothetical protein
MFPRRIFKCLLALAQPDKDKAVDIDGPVFFLLLNRFGSNRIVAGVLSRIPVRMDFNNFSWHSSFFMCAALRRNLTSSGCPVNRITRQ